MAAALKHSKQGKRGDPPPLSAISTENVGLAPSPSKTDGFYAKPGQGSDVWCERGDERGGGE